MFAVVHLSEEEMGETGAAEESLGLKKYLIPMVTLIEETFAEYQQLLGFQLSRLNLAMALMPNLL